jgi:hypothetical protein
VDELQLTVAAEGLWVSRQSCSVPSVVTGKLAGQVGGSLGEGAQELGAVGACSSSRSGEQGVVSKACGGGQLGSWKVGMSVMIDEGRWDGSIGQAVVSADRPGSVPVNRTAAGSPGHASWHLVNASSQLRRVQPAEVECWNTMLKIWPRRCAGDDTRSAHEVPDHAKIRAHRRAFHSKQYLP